jgi:alpha-L-fucosidase
MKSFTFKLFYIFFFSLLLVNMAFSQMEKKEDRDKRMEWWRDARFGMFIHWGLYSIPAGEWKNETHHGEWIRNTAHIPLEVYDKFVNQFNPVKFNAEEWVKMAKDAGMKYIVITTKHHDGFCLFDTKFTDFNVMSTPFKRDIMKEISAACKKEGIKMCWYHSIMDWHHPDYLPRREWEKERPTEGADFERFYKYLKNELKELLTNYGEIGVLWFDGEWESTWNTKYGIDLYNYVRSLQPNIIINNRVGAGRSGMQGFTKEGEFSGDFGTPEQEIPPTGIKGIDWETCMTMNNNWGYNKHDKNFKSVKDLLQKLADIASKGGNFLLNIGPTSEGVFPQESIERLKEIGKWMKVNGSSIYGTQASPFKNLEWGRCTQKKTTDGTRLFLHVFDWPKDGKLAVTGLGSKPKNAFLLSDEKQTSLGIIQQNDAVVINIPVNAPDEINSVVVLDISGEPVVYEAPEFNMDVNIFIDEIKVPVLAGTNDVVIHYTLDNSIPSNDSPIVKDNILLKETSIISIRSFKNGLPVSGINKMKFEKVKPLNPVKINDQEQGVKYSIYEGTWDMMPDFTKLNAAKSGVIKNFDISAKKSEERYGFEFNAMIKIPKDGIYEFFTESDDGSMLYIDGLLIVNNDSLHGNVEKRGVVPLSAGYHSIKVDFFQKSGGQDLKVSFKAPGEQKMAIPSDILFYRKEK